MRRWRDVDLYPAIVPAWCAALVLAICAPMLRGGYVLSYDMVWVPDLDLDRPEIWGLGSGLPRAVPSDAVVALLDVVLPAAVVQRGLLAVALFALALGVARLLRERFLVAQLAGATFAVWNPFVAERLVLGQWPLIIGLAAFAWLVGALQRDAPRWTIVTVCLAATAMSPATGAMGLVVALAAGWRHGPVRVTLLAALVNAPWIVSGLLHSTSATSDPAAVDLFDLRGEGSFGKLGSALTLGGIWNADVVPTSRTLVIAVLIGLLIGVVMIVGLVTLWRDDRRLLVALAVPAVLGLAVALTGWLAPDLVERVVADVPGGGLVRDGTRWLAMLLPLEAVAFGAGICAAFDRAEFTSWQYPTIVLALVVPIAALPDIAWGVGGRLEPTTYPASWVAAREAIARSEVPGDILVLPFTAYRRPAWNDDTPVLDPAGRYFDRTTVTNDELEVSGRPIAGEDPRAAAIGRVLERSGDVPRSLARRGIRFVVVETDAIGARAAVRQVRGAREVEIDGEGIRVFQLSDVRVREVDPTDRWIMTGTWVVTGVSLLLALVGLLRAGVGRLHRKPAEHRPRQVPQP